MTLSWPPSPLHDIPMYDRNSKLHISLFTSSPRQCNDAVRKVSIWIAKFGLFSECNHGHSDVWTLQKQALWYDFSYCTVQAALGENSLVDGSQISVLSEWVVRLHNRLAKFAKKSTWWLSPTYWPIGWPVGLEPRPVDQYLMHGGWVVTEVNNGENMAS